MPPNMTKRILNEIFEANEDKEAQTPVVVPDESNIYHLIGSVQGPRDTPYEGGTFLIDINLHKNHPFGVPTMKFITQVFHPNVSSQTGAICLDVLKSNWTPAMTLRLSLMSIQSLLDSADPTSPQDAEVAAVYTSDRQRFNQEAALWTKNFAVTTIQEHLATINK